MFDKAKNYVARRAALLEAQRANGRRSSGLYTGHDIGPAGAQGRLVVELQPCDRGGSPTGPWEKVVDEKNLVVRQAEALMAQMAIAGLNAELSYIELGDPAAPANPPTLSDLTLQSSTGQRKAVTLTAVGNQVQGVATWSTVEGNGFTYTEAGFFTGLLGAGTMFARKTFSGIVKTGSFQMKFTWYLTFLVNTSGGSECAGVALTGPSTVSARTFYAPAAGGEASIAATFDFAVGADNVDVYLRGVRLIPGVHYQEAAAGALVAPVGGPAGNKGINLVGFTLIPNDEVFLIQRTLG